MERTLKIINTKFRKNTDQKIFTIFAKGKKKKCFILGLVIVKHITNVYIHTSQRMKNSVTHSETLKHYHQCNILTMESSVMYHGGPFTLFGIWGIQYPLQLYCTIQTTYMYKKNNPTIDILSSSFS